jgi:serine/threonine protein phosphatase PrpC
MFRHANRLAIYGAILFIICLWCLIFLSLQRHMPDSPAEPNVRTSREKATKQANALLQKNALPVWKQTLHQSADVALTGAFRYHDTAECDNVCELFLPSLDLKAAMERDEAQDLLRNGRILQKVTLVADRSITQNLEAFPNHALLTRGGNKAFGPNGVKANQDRALLLSPFSFRKPFSENDLVMALFDGHGLEGHVVSHYVALQLPRVLSKMLGEHSPADALTQTFLNLEETLPRDTTEGSGSTAIVMLRLQDTLYVANAGDSLAFVASYDGGVVEILYQTKPHKPHFPEERARIEKAGGEVMEPQSLGDSSRVLIYQNGGMVMALAMSRSIGDVEGSAIGVIAEPTVDAVDLKTLAPSHKKLFAVAASDGLFDHVPPQEVATELAKSLFASSSISPLEVCERLIMKSSRGWIANGMPYRDDITVATTILHRD